MKFATLLLALLLAAPVAAQDEPAPAEEDAEPDRSAPAEESAEPDRSGWNAVQWMTEFYARKTAGDTGVLQELLDGAAKASGRTPELDQNIAGETGYLAKGQGRLEDSARGFAKAADGPNEDAAVNAAAELKIVRDYILQQGREQREAVLFDDAVATFELAGELGADPGVVAEELNKVEERRTLFAEGGAPEETSATGPTWGKPPKASEALSDPVPPPLTDEEWLAEFNEEKDAGADIEDLEVILEDLEDDDDGSWTQRLAIERGYLGIDAGDKLAAGRAFLKAFDGDDEGLTTRADSELRKLQRHFRLLAVQYTHQGDIARAHRAFQTAGALGADAQLVAYERSYIAGLDGDEEKVKELLAEASEGPNRSVGDQAAFELAARSGTAGGGPPESQKHITAFLEHRDAERWDEADAELDLAEEEGASHQLVEIYRGYLDKLRKDDFAARKHFKEAAKGEDEDLAKQAKAELRYTAKPVWGDLYGEGFGWARIWPEEQRFDDFAWLLRARGYLHPFPKVGFDPYIFFQLSGDVKSQQAGNAASFGQPLIYADNTALVGGGLLLRFWKNRISLWGQVGAAFPWVKLTSDPPVQLDIQIGGAIMFASKECRPPDGAPAYVTTMWCAEFYGDTVYRNRPYDNVFFSARGRIGLHYLVTGPVAWSPVFEVRFMKDVRNDFWANLIDAGIMHRWRLMGPVGVDLTLGIHAGTLFGLSRVDQPPPILGYVDLRLGIAAYVAF
jgi:hypothetical protein